MPLQIQYNKHNNVCCLFSKCCKCQYCVLQWGNSERKKMLMDNVTAEVSKHFPHFHKIEEIWFIRLKVCAERGLVGENDEEPIQLLLGTNLSSPSSTQVAVLSFVLEVVIPSTSSHVFASAMLSSSFPLTSVSNFQFSSCYAYLLFVIIQNCMLFAYFTFGFNRVTEFWYPAVFSQTLWQSTQVFFQDVTKVVLKICWNQLSMGNEMGVFTFVI